MTVNIGSFKKVILCNGSIINAKICDITKNDEGQKIYWTMTNNNKTKTMIKEFIK